MNKIRSNGVRINQYTLGALVNPILIVDHSYTVSQCNQALCTLVKISRDKILKLLLEAKILAVADVVEAMLSDRPYRTAPGLTKALEEISNNVDTLYDQKVVQACLDLFQKNKFKFE